MKNYLFSAELRGYTTFMPDRMLTVVACLLSISLSAIATGYRPEPRAADFASAQPAGRVIELSEWRYDVEDFILEANDTLIVRQSVAIVADQSIVLRGKVVVELPDDAPQGARAPRLLLRAGRGIVLMGEMVFGDGRPGIDEGVMGGLGGSLYLQAPIIGIGIAALRMGDGAAGGPNVEGGGGGTFETYGWVIPFHNDGFTVRGGRGGDGGEGLAGTERHARGRRGGDGGLGGTAVARDPWFAVGDRDFESVSALALGVAAELDPFVGPDRRDCTASTYIGGDGGNGGNGGVPWAGGEKRETKVGGGRGGGRGGDGGMGGFAGGAWGPPGAPPKINPRGNPPYLYAMSMHGQRGGNAIGGNGGAGGFAGEGPSLYATVRGGAGGDGGDAYGGVGGAKPTVPPGTPAQWVGDIGPGGSAQGGNGGHGGSNNDGGDGGHSTPGPDGTWTPPPAPEAVPN